MAVRGPAPPMPLHRHAVVLSLAALLAAAGSASAGLDVWTPGSQPGGNVFSAALAGDWCYAGSVRGLRRSSDGCQTWSRVEALADKSVHQVAIDTVQPTTAYAATSEGLWRTLDGGINWATIVAGGGGFDEPVNAVAVNPAQAGEAWFASATAVTRTTTSGDGFPTSVTDNLTLPVRGLVVDPTNGWTWAWTFQGVFVRFAGTTTWQTAVAGSIPPRASIRSWSIAGRAGSFSTPTFTSTRSRATARPPGCRSKPVCRIRGSS